MCDFEPATGGWGGKWTNPGLPQAPTPAVVCVSWADAITLCDCLTQRERAAHRLSKGQEYRLPTDAEWSLAVGLGVEPGQMPAQKQNKILNHHPWGTHFPPPEEAANLNRRFAFSAPVGSFTPNRYGLYDLGGNVWQWCEDEYQAPPEEGRSAHRHPGVAWGILELSFRNLAAFVLPLSVPARETIRVGRFPGGAGGG